MNRPLLRLSVVSMLLLVTLVVATTYWQSWAVGGLRDRQDNAIQQVAQFTIARGRIIAGNEKTTLAANRRVRVDDQTFYFRRYPQRGLAAQTVGYSTKGGTRAGLERSLDDYLTGANTNLSNALERALDELGGTVHGNDVVLTIRPIAQRLALRLLGGRCGAVVAMDPHSGRIYVLASAPTYDPNLLERRGGYARILATKAECPRPAPLLNRATAGLFTPGSTFKLVTAAAALDTGAFTPDSGFDDPGYCIEYGKRVSNAGNPDQTGPETFGHVTLAQGLEHSINSVFCNVGKALGAKTILEYAKRFGFYSTPPLETPADERAPSGLYDHGRLYWPKDFNAVDPGRLAFGQERMQATPLQMALLAATIANGGVVPRPYLVQRVVAPDGSIVASTHAQTLGRAIKPETAAALTEMMKLVVQGGTGTAAQIPGVEVAGKTGTAETAVSHVYDAWFVCFAPADHPRVAVAVVVEDQPNGFGGTVAAPIAKAVLETLLRG